MHKYALLSVLLVLVAGFHVVDATVFPAKREPTPDDGLPTTNAERLARGLKLLKPRSLDPTRVIDIAKRQKTSAVPRAQACIKAKSLYRGYENLSGYLTYAKHPPGHEGRDFLLTPHKEHCVRVYVPNDLKTRTDSFSIELVQAHKNFPDLKYIAAAHHDPAQKQDITDDEKDYIKLTVAKRSRAPAHGFSAYQGSYTSETKLFEYDQTKKTLPITYINKEGHEIKLTVLVENPTYMTTRPDHNSGYVHLGATSSLDTSVKDQPFELSFEL